MKIAVEYCRASTDMQEHSVDDQHTYNSEWAKRNGYKIIKTYKDDGISGASAKKRPAFLQMIDDSIDNHWDAVLVYDSSRFARNLMEFLAYKKILLENGSQLIAVTEPQIDSEMSLFYDAINGASNEMYLRKLSRDISRGILEKTKRGEYTGRAPFGWRKVAWENNYQVDATERKWAVYIFEAVRDNVRYVDILDTLRSNEIKMHSGNYFDSRAIYRMIKNKLYKGYFDFSISGTDLVDVKASNVSPIIDDELWAAANASIDKRAQARKYKGKPSHIRKHWLSGHIYCDNCGSSLCYAHKKNWAPRFQCKGYSKGLHCTASVKISIVEDLVLSKMQELFNGSPSEYEKCVTALPPKTDIDYDAEISKVKASLTRAKKAYLAEVDTLEEYKENKLRLTEKLNSLEQKKEASTMPAPINIEEFRNKLLSAITILQSDVALEEKMIIADTLIDSVKVNVTNKTIDIYFFA